MSPIYLDRMYNAPVLPFAKMLAANNTDAVQKRATTLIIALKHPSYNERLKELQLSTLKYRRLRGDMIQVSKWYIPIL